MSASENNDTKSTQLPRDSLLFALGSLGYSGASPIMPGTCGTLVAALPAALLVAFGIPLSLAPTLSITLGLTLIGWYLAGRSVQQSGDSDPQWFVLDEAAGVWLALIGLHELGFLPDWQNLLIATIAFRIFDMTKPAPLGWLEKRGGGAGVMLDDLAAGVCAWAICATAGILLAG